MISAKKKVGAAVLAGMFAFSGIACQTQPQDCDPVYKKQQREMSELQEAKTTFVQRGGSSGGGGGARGGGGSSSSGSKASPSSGGSKPSSSSAPRAGNSGLGTSKGFKSSSVPKTPKPGVKYKVHDKSKDHPYPIVAVYDDDGGCELRYDQ